MGEPGYFRSPTIRGDNVVFASEGALCSVPPKGGVACRLTPTMTASPTGDLVSLANLCQDLIVVDERAHGLPDLGGRPGRRLPELPLR